MGLFWIIAKYDYCYDAVSLNPRFDGAFLNYEKLELTATCSIVLIPDLMGLFWIIKAAANMATKEVLIPDLMGLFWIPDEIQVLESLAAS